MASKEGIKEYYKNIVADPSQDEFQGIAVTSCSRKPLDVPTHVTNALGLVHEDVIKRCYGCSTAYPEALEDCSILDLGCGAGRDCFVLSKLVGEKGRVLGVDMLAEMVDFANTKVQYHQSKFGYSSPNVSFKQGYMETLDELGLAENSFDVVVSNCVISLCKDKTKVLKEVARVLKPNGELYFSDMYRHGDLPLELMDDNQLWCEGITGSMAYTKLHKIAIELGFAAPRLVRARDLPIIDKTVKDKIGETRYAAVTYRLYKKSKESSSNPGTFTYTGAMLGSECVFKFAHDLHFDKNTPINVDAETATILSGSRFSKFFDKSDPMSSDCTKTFEYQVVDPFTIIS